MKFNSRLDMTTRKISYHEKLRGTKLFIGRTISYDQNKTKLFFQTAKNKP